MCGCERAVISKDSLWTLFQHPFDQIIFDSDDIHIRLGQKPELLFQLHIQSGQVTGCGADEIRSAPSQAAISTAKPPGRENTLFHVAN